MVDRRQVNGRYDPWSFTTKSVEYARNNDVHTIRRILQSDAFREAPASRKFILLKAIVKDFGCVRSVCGLLQRHVFSRSAGGSSTAILRPDMVDSQGSSLAHWAAQASDPTPVLKTLRDLGCPLKSVNKAGMSPLHYLFWKNCPTDDFRLREAARFLKSSGCLVDLRDRIGETVFHVACLRKDLGANLHMKTAKQESALHLVAASCDPVFLVSAFEFLINEGVEVSARDDADKTALYYISERKKIDPELRSQIISLIRPVAAHHHFTGSDVNSDTDSLLSPQTSSDLGFSEKLSLDDLPGTPESGSAFRHFAVPDCVSSRHSVGGNSSTSTNSARFSPYEPRRPPRQHRSSTQDLYSLSTSSYSPGGVTSPVHAFVPIHPHSPQLTHQPMPAQTTPIPSTSRAPSNMASSSKSKNALALTNALHPPPPPPTPQHAQHDAQTSTDDITQASRCLPMSPVSGSIMPGTVHREPMSPRCRLWRMGELENALPRTVSESGHIVVSPNSSGLCTCSRCQRENLDRLEELERTVQDLTRQNADMRQQFDDLQQKNQSIRERAQRIETCAICCFPYSEERDNVDASNRCTFRKCGHICCTKCVQQQLSLAQSGDDNEPPRCPFHTCRTPFSTDDVVTLKF